MSPTQLNIFHHSGLHTVVRDVKEALNRAVKDSGHSRDQVLDRMNELARRHGMALNSKAGVSKDLTEVAERRGRQPGAWDQRPDAAMRRLGHSNADGGHGRNHRRHGHRRRGREIVGMGAAVSQNQGCAPENAKMKGQSHRNQGVDASQRAHGRVDPERISVTRKPPRFP